MLQNITLGKCTRKDINTTLLKLLVSITHSGLTTCISDNYLPGNDTETKVTKTASSKQGLYTENKQSGHHIYVAYFVMHALHGIHIWNRNTLKTPNYMIN